MVRHRRSTVILLALSVAAVTLAGCVGPEEPAPATDADGAAPSADSGAVKGQVVTKDLDHVQGATVALVLDGEIAMDTTTDENGGYLFNGVEPGHYRVQVSSICCKSALGTAHVEAKSIVEVNFQLDLLSADDLKDPHTVSEEWTGFVACGVGTAAVSWATCSTLGDPNDEFMLEFNVSRGIKTLVMAMDWEPAGGVSGQEFSINVENDDCAVDACSYRYADLEGSPPLVVSISNDDITDDEWKWDTIDGQRPLQFRVFPSGDATAVYQQPFQVYYHAFYWEEAPEGFDPLPDE